MPAGFIPKRILLPINGAETDDEAVRLACRLARRGGAEISVVTVLEVSRSIALGEVSPDDLDAAERRLARAEEVAKELDAELQTEIIQAREAGPAIVDEARRWAADLLVMGMPFRERFGEFFMGKSVPYILRNAPCRTMIFREPEHHSPVNPDSL